jgi:hypothetical protein
VVTFYRAKKLSIITMPNDTGAPLNPLKNKPLINLSLQLGDFCSDKELAMLSLAGF